MKLLFLCDSLFLPTGIAKVGRELAVRLAMRGHQVGYIGLFHRSDTVMKVPDGMHYWFTNNNHYGSDILDGVISNFRPDILLTIGDMWNFQYITNPEVCRTRRLFSWAAYIAVDGEPYGGGIPLSLIPIIEDVDIPVAYTEYAKRAILKSCKDAETQIRTKVIYHGVDPDTFKPLPFAERKDLRTSFGLDDKFVFLCIARNQSRKNIPETFHAWRIFSEMPEAKDRVIFWPHMHFNDPMGWNISEMIESLGMQNKRSIMYYRQVAHAPSELHLIPEAEVAKLYQIADAFVLISGEGFGLPTFEAMSTKVPTILLNSAASAELGADGRAELVPVDGAMLWTAMHQTQRPMPAPEKIAESMLRIYRDKSHRDSIVKKAHDFVSEYSWDKVAEDWNQLFLSLEIPFLKPLELEVCS